MAGERFGLEPTDAETSLVRPPADIRPRPLADFEAQLAESEIRHEWLRAENARLGLEVLHARESQAAAERTQQRQTVLLAVIAHELRNPLTPIRTAAYLLNDVAPEALPRLQETIERQVVQLSRLVHDLVDVSRMMTGKFSLDPSIVEMSGIIDAAIDACRPAMDARQQTFNVEVPSCAIEVHGDQGRLVQILSNLFDNASKYATAGSEIRLSVVVHDGAVVMTLSDTGIGISAELLPEIFELFVQGTHAAGIDRSGMGIGLTVVRELVEAHGGTVVASSAGADLGSRFVVTLPLAANGGQPRSVVASPLTQGEAAAPKDVLPGRPQG